MPLPGSKLVSVLASAALIPLTACKNNGMPVYPEGYREFAYVANSAGNSVTALDLVYLRPDRTIDVGGDPTVLAVNPVRNEVYALNTQPAEAAGSVSVIDTASNTVTSTIPVHRDPTALAVDALGLRAYVANTGSNTLSVLDLATRRSITSLSTRDRPDGLAISPDMRAVVVTSQSTGTVTIYSSGLTAPLKRDDGAPSGPPRVTGAPLALRSVFSGCPGATAPAILPDSSKVFIACSTGHQVMILSLAAAPDSWPGRQDGTLLSDRLLTMLDVGSQPSHLAVKPDNGEVFAMNLGSDSVSEISATTNEVGSTYPIGNRPTHGLVSQDGSALWVAAPGTDSLSLYSIDDGKFVSSIRTGSAPDALAFSADQHLLLAADSKSGDVAVIRTQTKLGPALLTILPAGGGPSAIAIKAMPAKP